MGTNKTATARALIEPAGKREAESILEEFELQVPNEKTMKAIRRSRAGKGRRLSTAKELFKDLSI